MSAVQRLVSFFVLCLVVFLTPAIAQAQPTFSKVFAPDTIGPNSKSTLTYSITNTDPTPVSSLAFTDTLPTRFDPMRIALGGASTDCPDASLTAVAGTQTVALTNARLAAGSSCTITVNIEAGDAADVLTSTSGDLTSSAGNSGTATDDLTISHSLAGFTAAFAPSSVSLGGVSTLTFTIDNSRNASGVLNLDFTSQLPLGLEVASAANASTDCGTAIIPPVLTAVAGSTSIQLDSDGFGAFPAVAAGATCTVSVNVRATSLGESSIDTELLTSFVSSGNAVATLDVTASALNLSKLFVTNPATAGGTTELEFTLDNFNRSDSATNVAFTDDLGAALTGLTYDSLLSNTCGGTVGGVGTTTISFSGGTIPAEGQCTIRASLSVPSSAVGGSYSSSSSTVTADVGGSPTVGAAATDILFIPAGGGAPIMTLEILEVGTLTPDPAPSAGEDVIFRVTITNASTTDPATDVESIIPIAPPWVNSTAIAYPATPCGAGSTVSNIFPATGELSMSLTGGILAAAGTAGDSCTFDMTVTLPTGLASSTYSFAPEFVTATIDSATVSGTVSGDTVTVGSGVDLFLSAAFDGTAVPGATVDLTYTITKGAESADAANIIFTNDLTDVFAGLTANLPASTNTCGGTLAGSAGDTLLTYTGGALSGATTSCTVTVSLSVPSSAASGSFTNNTIAMTATPTSGTPTVTLTAGSEELSVAGLVFSKEFLTNPVIAGATTTLRYTIENVHPTDDATITFFTDSLSSALSALASNGATTIDTCGGAFSGTTVIIYTGGAVLSGQSCTIETVVTVPVGAVDNDYISTTSFLSATQSGGGVPIDPAVASLTVSSELLQLTKTFDADLVAPGDTVNLEFTLSNLSDQALDTIVFNDDLDFMLSGATAIGLPLTDICGTGSSLSGTSLVTFSGGILPATTGTCTFSVPVQIPGGVPTGTVVNTTSDVTALTTAGAFAVLGSAATDEFFVTDSFDVTFSKSFADTDVTAGGSTLMTFTIDNSAGSTALSSASFLDDLSGMLAGATASGFSVGSGCGPANLTGSSSLTFSNGEVAAGAVCTLTATLTLPATAAVASYTNTTSDLFAGGLSIAPAASASVTVQPAPTFAKGFAAATIALGDTSTLTFTINNSGSTLAATSLDFADNLPVGLQVANPSAATTTCTGGTLTAVPASGSLSYTGGSVASGASCTVQVDVLSTSTGSLVNTSGDLTSNHGNSGTSSATLTVVPQPVFTGAYSPLVVGVGQTTTVTFTIDNSGSTLAATALDFTETLSSDNLLIAATPNASTTCTGGTLTAVGGSGTLSYTGGSLAPGATCTVSADVTANTALTATRSTGDLTSSLGNSGGASTTVTFAAQPTFAKGFAPAAIAIDGASTLTFTINNASGVTTALTSLDFTDTLPAGLTVATPANASTTCTGGTLNAVSGTGVLSYSGGALASASSCTVQIDVTGAASGSFANTSGDLTSSVGNSGTASATLTIVPLPGFTQAIAPSALFEDQTARITFTIDNSGSTLPATGLSISQSLGFTSDQIAYPAVANEATTCTGGSITINTGANTLAYTGGTVAAGATCTLSVDVATSLLPGTNTFSPLLSASATSSLGDSGTALASINVGERPVFTKNFGDLFISVGGISTLSFTLNNASGPVDATSVSFSDSLPAGLVIAATPFVQNSCTGGTVTAVAGGGSVSYSGGTIGANATCSIAVDVTGTTGGTKVNTSGDLTSSAGNSGPATASIDVIPQPLFTKVFADPAVVQGGSTQMILTIDNTAGVRDVTALAVSDTFPTGMVVATPANASTTCTGGTLTAVAGAGTVSYSGGLVTANNSCQVLIDVTGNTVGDLVNTTGDLTSNVGNSGTANATLTVVPAPTFAKALSATTVSLGGSALVTYTIDNSASVLSATGMSFSETLPAGLVIATPSNAAPSCTGGTVTAVSGTNVISYTGTSVANGAACSLVVEVSPTAAGVYPLTSGDLTSSSGNSGTSTATLTVTTPEIDLVGSIGGAVANGGTLAQGNQPAGTFQTLTLTVTNNGTEDLLLSGALAVQPGSTNVDFQTFTGPADTTLAPTETTDIVVPYSPTVAGAFSFDVSLGNNDVDESPYVFTISGTGLDVTAPVGYSVVLDQDPVTLANQGAGSFTISDAEIGATHAYTIASSGGGSVTGSGAITTATQQVSGLDLSSLGDGTLTLTLALTDAATNTGLVATDTAVKDATAPSGYTVAFDQDPVNGANVTAMSFSFAGAEIGASYVYSITSDAGGGPVTGSGTIANGTDVISALDLSGLGDGTLTLTASLTDPVGNAGADVTATVAKDTLAPAIAIDTPIAGDGIINAAEAVGFAVTGTSSGMPDGSRVNLSITVDGVTVGGLTTTVTAGLWSVPFDMTFFSDNSVVVRAQGFDLANNPSALATATGVYDSTAPSGYSASFDQDPVNLANASAIGFTFAGAEVGAAFAYSITSDGGGAAVTGSGTIATATDQIAGLDLSGLGDGTLTLTVALTDVAGNAGVDATDTTTKDATAATGYSVTFGFNPISAQYQTAAEINFFNWEVPSDFVLTITSSGGAGSVVRSGVVGMASGTFSPLDLSGLPDGILTATVVLTDEAGNSGVAATTTATKDTIAPLGYAVSFDQDPYNISNAASASITLTGAEVGAIYAFTISSSGGGVNVTNSGTVTTATQQFTGLDLSGLADGTITVQMILIDSPAANAGLSVTSTTVKDVTLPSLTIDSPLTADGVINAAEAATVTVSGTSSDLADGTVVTVAVSDGAAGNVSGTATVSAGVWSLSLDLTALADGPLTLTADATDAAGNPAPQATATASKDTVPPAGYAAGFDQDPVNAANETAVSFTFAGAEVGAAFTYSISSDGGGAPVTGSGTIATATDQVSGLQLNGLSDGTLTLTVALTDPAGNTGADATATATKDATLPSLTIDAPITADDVINAAEAATVTLSGTSTDLLDGPVVSVAVTDGAAGSVAGTATVASGIWSVTLDLSSLADGPLTIAADASDAAGNPAPQVSSTTAKDATAPAGYSASFDQDPVNVANAAAVGFTFAGAEPGAAFTYSIASDGGGTPVVGSGTIVTATDNIVGLDLSALGDGTLTLTVALTDPAGNTGANGTATATKDAAAPTVTLAGPTDERSDPFIVTATFSEDVFGFDLARVTLVNGVASNLTGSGTSYSFTVTPNHDGTVSISLDPATASDGAGNPSAAGGPIEVTADLTGTPDPTPPPDGDGDGIADSLESASADRDGDGIVDSQDFDPQGYFYCEADGRIIPGGSVTVSGPLGSNSALGSRNGINMTRDGSTGEIQWFALVPGNFSMALTYPTAVGIPSTSRLPSGTLDLTTLLPTDPASIGSSEFGSTGVLADGSLAANPRFYTAFDIQPGDPFVLGNNIPMTQCATNPVVVSASTNGAEANGAVPTDPTFTITQDRLSTQATVIAYTVGGTATSGTDFTALSGSVTIPAGATTATITVPLLEDGAIEGSETVTVTLTSITSGDLTTQLGATLTGTATIVDDDFANIAVTNVDLVTNEGGGDDATMTFVLLGAPTSPVTLNFVGDAQCGVSPASLTFTAGNYTVAQALRIRAIDDDKVEGTHSCQPTATVSSADARFNGTPLPLATVTVTDDLVDQVREPLTTILEEDLSETIQTQQRSFNRMAKGALQRLQAGQDLPCGTLSGFDIDGSIEIQDATGSAQGTFGSDVYNCVTNTREILDGSFSLNKTEDTGLQAILQFALQRERFVSDSALAGYFFGGYLSRTDVSGLGDGSINGIGVNAGLYGARGFSEGLFMDYYVAAAAGRHSFDIDFDAAPADIKATGDYGYLAGFAGVGISGQQEFDTFVMKPRVAIDLAYAFAGDADVTAQQLGLTHTGVIKLDDYSGARVTAEVTFESLGAPGGSEAMAIMMRTAITPRFVCNLSSYEDEAECGVGLGFAWERTNTANGTIFGIEVDAESIDDSQRLTFNLTRERPIANGQGAVVTRLSMPQAETWQVEHGVKLDF